MPNIFATADAKSSAVVDRLYGERLQRVPWLRGGGYTVQGEPDPGRRVASFIGTLSGALGDQDSGGDRRGGDFRGNFTTRDRTITVDIRNWPADTREGDHMIALDQPGLPVYEIVGAPQSDGMNRMIVNLVIYK